MKLYYRISDKGYDKPKLIGATKEVCLSNFIKAFHPVIFESKDNDTPYPIKIIADRCNPETEVMLKNTKLPVISTDLGNAGSLRYALADAVEKYDDDELVYFCEDDYLHRQTAPQLLQEGIQRADYVTLYDHPDKYMPQYNCGEFSKVIKTKSTHWRYTISTCMTFGTTVKTLREDMDVWLKYTDGPHPHDHYIFTELNKEKKRRLSVCIPGVACHTDLEYSIRMKQVLIDSWAIDLMVDHLESEIRTSQKEELILPFTVQTATI